MAKKQMTLEEGMAKYFGVDHLSNWHKQRTMSIARKAGTPAFDIVEAGRKSGYMGDNMMVFIDDTPGMDMSIETFKPKSFYYVNTRYPRLFTQSAMYVVIFTDGGKVSITDNGVFVYHGEFSRKGTTGRYFDFAGMGMSWGNKYGRDAYMEAGIVVYEGLRWWEMETGFKADYKDYDNPHDFVVAIRKARVEVLKKYHEWGVPFRHEFIGSVSDVKTAEEASAKAKELFGVEIPADVFQQNIDCWRGDYKSMTISGRYYIFTPCGHNDLRFDIGYNIAEREGYVA